MAWIKCDADCPARANNHYILTNLLELHACMHHAREMAAEGIEEYVLAHEVEANTGEPAPVKPTPADVYRR